MGRSFKATMAKGDDPLEQFDRIEPEVDFSQGRPDFVGVITGKRSQTTLPRLFARTKVPRSHIARILTVIQRDESIRVLDLAQAAAVTVPRTRSIIKPLERIGAVCTDASDTLRVVDLNLISKPDLWAFELKLDDWKRCLFQTLVCRSYASRVTAVFPAAKAKHIEQVAPTFAQHGIGVMLFDAQSRRLRPVVNTAARKPMSAYHAWMSCFEISDSTGRKRST
jgi:hypothetical protein